MAVAGFSEKDLEISVKDNMLTIEGNRTHDHHWYSKRRRAFIQRISRKIVQTIVRLQEYVEIEKADLNIGILSVFLKRNLPEAKNLV